MSGEPTGRELTARVVAGPAPGQGCRRLQIESEDLTVVPFVRQLRHRGGTEVVAVGYPVSVDLVTDVDFNPSFKGRHDQRKEDHRCRLTCRCTRSAPPSPADEQWTRWHWMGTSSGSTVSGSPMSHKRSTSCSQPRPWRRCCAAGSRNTLGPVTEEYRAGLNAYFAGDRDAAVPGTSKRFCRSCQTANSRRVPAEGHKPEPPRRHR